MCYLINILFCLHPHRKIFNFSRRTCKIVKNQSMLNSHIYDRNVGIGHRLYTLFINLNVPINSCNEWFVETNFSRPKQRSIRYSRHVFETSNLILFLALSLSWLWSKASPQSLCLNKSCQIRFLKTIYYYSSFINTVHMICPNIINCLTK